MGRDFDARAFARVFKRAHVDSVTLFAKCHHGHLYYNTDRPERHPGLAQGLNLLGAQIEALHREGIRAPIYLSVQCDEYAANTHPEWVARNADTSQVKWGGSVFKPGWQILDMSTPYQAFFAEQTFEVLKLFKPVDGIFFDMCWDQPSTTREFISQVRKLGGNPENETDRVAYAHQLALGYMKRFHAMVQDSTPGASVYFNGRHLPNLAEEIAFQEQIEIEALPTGGWGYIYFPKNVRFARNFGKPYLGMTARFHKSWADFGGLKPQPALEYETSQMIAHGARCSIGDQLHPRGVPDRAAYDLIGSVYKRVADREPWLLNATPVTEIGLFQAPAVWEINKISGIDEGATRLLTQLKLQFNVVEASSDLTPFRLLILPDSVPVDAALAKILQAHLKRGGAILATGTSGMNADATACTFPQLGVNPLGMSPFGTTYFRVIPEMQTDIPDSDHVMYDTTVRVVTRRGCRMLADVIEPYFDRTWDHFSSHFQTPPDRASGYAAATINGQVGYISAPIFGAFAQHGNAQYRLLVRNLINLLMPLPLIQVQAPTSTEVTVTRQETPTARTIVHLLQYCPERRAINLDLIEDIVPLYDVAVSLKLEKKPRQVYLAPDKTQLAFTFRNGRAQVRVPKVAGHAMLVFE